MNVQTPIAAVRVTSFLSQDPGVLIKTTRGRRCPWASVLHRRVTPLNRYLSIFRARYPHQNQPLSSCLEVVGWSSLRTAFLTIFGFGKIHPVIWLLAPNGLFQ
jgi:hypothetical protein